MGPDAETRHLLAQSGIRLPCIVKPRVACGTPEAHQMAVVLHEDGFQDLQVLLAPLAVVWASLGSCSQNSSASPCALLTNPADP